MEIWRLLNRGIRYLEFLVVAFVLLLYVLECYETARLPGRAAPLFFLLTSLCHYISCLAKSPGQLLDFDDASIKGMCKKCNRIVGSRTVHCEICNKCYHKRDHHCPIIGKCVASDNFRNLYFATLFMVLYVLLAAFRVSQAHHVLLHKYLFVLLSAVVCWMTLLLVADKTTAELVASRQVRQSIRLSRLGKLLDKGLLGILAPYAAWKTSVVK